MHSLATYYMIQFDIMFIGVVFVTLFISILCWNNIFAAYFCLFAATLSFVQVKIIRFFESIFTLVLKNFNLIIETTWMYVWASAPQSGALFVLILSCFFFCNIINFTIQTNWTFFIAIPNKVEKAFAWL